MGAKRKPYLHIKLEKLQECNFSKSPTGASGEHLIVGILRLFHRNFGYRRPLLPGEGLGRGEQENKIKALGTRSVDGYTPAQRVYHCDHATR